MDGEKKFAPSRFNATCPGRIVGINSSFYNFQQLNLISRSIWEEAREKETGFEFTIHYWSRRLSLTIGCQQIWHDCVSIKCSKSLVPFSAVSVRSVRCLPTNRYDSFHQATLKANDGATDYCDQPPASLKPTIGLSFVPLVLSGPFLN